MHSKSYTRRRRNQSTAELWTRSCTCELTGRCRTCVLWSQLIAKVAIRKASINSMLAQVTR